MSLSNSPHDKTWIINQLRRAGCVYAEDEAAVIMATSTDEAEVALMVAARASGQPPELVVGWAEFCGQRILVGPGVFVPRRRSEFLVEVAAHFAQPGDVVIDVGCGSGALGVALSSAIGEIDLYATDIEPVAATWARRNVTKIGGHVYQGDLFQALPPELQGRAKVILANAPYVPTDDIELLPAEARLYEPQVTLDGGPDGLNVQRRVTAAALPWLAPGRRLFMETSQAQAAITTEIFAINQFKVNIEHDPDRDATVVVGTV